MRKLIPISSIASLLIGVAASAYADETCYIQDLQCTAPDGGPTITVSAKVWPEGFGIGVFIIFNEWEPETALHFSYGYASEVMAFKGWCLHGYEDMSAPRESDKFHAFKFVCK